MQHPDLEQFFRDPRVDIGLGVLGVGLLVVIVREFARMPRSLMALTATAFLDMVGLLMVVPLVPFYVKRFAPTGVAVMGVELGLGEITAIVVTAYTLAQSVSSTWWGRFSDRFGRRPALMVAMFASAVAYVVFGFAESLLVLLASRVVQGAGGGTVGVIQAYVADTIEPAQRSRALGWLSAATNLGVALGPLLGKYAVDLQDVDLLPGAATWTMGHAAPGIVAALLCLFTLGFAAIYLPESNTAHHGAERPPRPKGRVLEVLQRPSAPASRLILTYAIAIGAFQGTTAVLQLFLNKRFGVTEKEVGWFYTYIGTISVLTRVLLLPRMVDRLGELRLSRLGIALLAGGLALMPAAESLPMLALAVAMIPLGTAFTFPCVTALLSGVVASTERGLYMGLQQTYGGFARIAMPLFYGWVFDRMGSGAPYGFAAAFVLATMPLCFGLGAVVPARKR